jgi:hypothetical protein
MLPHRLYVAVPLITGCVRGFLVVRQLETLSGAT